MTPLLLSALLINAAATPPPPDKLRLGVDYRWWGRNQAFQGTPADLVSQTTGPHPTGITFDIQWFPASHFVSDWRTNLGVTFRADITPEVPTVVRGSSFKSTAARVRTGLMYRLPFEHVEPSLQLGFQAFEGVSALRANDGAPRPRMPNVSYQGPRLAAGLRLLEFWRVTFDLNFGATFLLGVGELGSQAFFPGAKGAAYDGNVGLAFRTWPFLDLRVGVDVMVSLVDLGRGASSRDTYYGVSFGLVFKGVPLSR